MKIQKVKTTKDIHPIKKSKKIAESIKVNPETDLPYHRKPRYDKITGKQYGNPTLEAGVERGLVINVVTGERIPLDKFEGNVASDHILPQSVIKEIPGFKTAPKKVQDMILTDPNNIQYLSKPHNSSKGAKWFRKTPFKTFKGQPLNSGYLKNLDMIQRENYKNYKDLLEKYSK